LTSQVSSAHVPRDLVSELTSAAVALEERYPIPDTHGDAALMHEHSHAAPAHRIATVFEKPDVALEEAAVLRSEADEVAIEPSRAEGLHKVMEVIEKQDAISQSVEITQPDEKMSAMQDILTDVVNGELLPCKEATVEPTKASTEAKQVDRKASSSLELEQMMSAVMAMSAENLESITDIANELEVASLKVKRSAAAAEPSGVEGFTEPEVGGTSDSAHRDAARRQFTRAASQLEEMLQPKQVSSRRSLVRKASTKDLSFNGAEGKDLVNKVQVVANVFETLSKEATQEELPVQAAPPGRPMLSRSVSRSSTTSLDKICKKCRNCYSGFGDTCGRCRKFGRAGSMLQCSRCQSYFAGFGSMCKDCTIPEDRAAALAVAAEQLAAAAVAIAAVSQMFAPPQTMKSVA